MSSITNSIICPTCKESIPQDYVVCPYDGTSLVKEIKEKARVKLRFREGVGRVIRLLTRPQKTEELMKEFAANPDRKGGVIVLYLASFLFAFRLAPYSNGATGKSFDILYFLILGISSGLFIGIVLFIFAILFWYILTFIFHTSAKYLSGSKEVTFKEAQGLVGYMFTPLIAGLFLLNLILFFIAPNTSQPSIDEGYITINLLFIGLSFLWGIYIASIGAEELYRINKLQSTILAAIIPILVLWISFFT